MIEKITDALNNEYLKYNDGDWNSAIDRAISIVQEVAKEYGKDANVPSRCDTCTHYVADEVPPICYMCSKGIEDNYERKGE